MPTYNYACQDCGAAFRVRLSYTELDSARPSCPECAGQHCERGLSRVNMMVGGGSDDNFTLTREHVESAIGMSNVMSGGHSHGGCGGSCGGCSGCSH